MVDGSGKGAAGKAEAAILRGAVIGTQCWPKRTHFSPRLDSRLDAACHLSPILSRCGQLAHQLHAADRLMSPRKTGCGLLVLAAIAALSGSMAGAQNLDQGKPATKLFAESCATCHRSPRGLT